MYPYEIETALEFQNAIAQHVQRRQEHMEMRSPINSFLPRMSQMS